MTTFVIASGDRYSSASFITPSGINTVNATHGGNAPETRLAPLSANWRLRHGTTTQVGWYRLRSHRIGQVVTTVVTPMFRLSHDKMPV